MPIRAACGSPVTPSLYPTSLLPFGPLELGYAGQPIFMVPVAEIVSLLESPTRSIPVSRKLFLGLYVKVVDGGYGPNNAYH